MQRGDSGEESTEYKDFGHLTKAAVKTLARVLSIKVMDTDIKMLAMQKDAAVSVLHLAIKADEARFRARSEGGLNAILEEVRALREASTSRVVYEEWEATPPPTPLLQ